TCGKEHKHSLNLRWILRVSPQNKTKQARGIRDFIKYISSTWIHLLIANLSNLYFATEPWKIPTKDNNTFRRGFVVVCEYVCSDFYVKKDECLRMWGRILIPFIKSCSCISVGYFLTFII